MYVWKVKYCRSQIIINQCLIVAAVTVRIANLFFSSPIYASILGQHNGANHVDWIQIVTKNTLYCSTQYGIGITAGESDWGVQGLDHDSNYVRWANPHSWLILGFYRDQVMLITMLPQSSGPRELHAWSW